MTNGHRPLAAVRTGGTHFSFRLAGHVQVGAIELRRVPSRPDGYQLDVIRLANDSNVNSNRQFAEHSPDSAGFAFSI